MLDLWQDYTIDDFEEMADYFSPSHTDSYQESILAAWAEDLDSCELTEENQ